MAIPGLTDLMAWLRQLLTWFISEAPYPIKAMFWILLLLTMGSIVNIFFAFNHVCTTDGTLYTPASALQGVNMQFKRIALSNNLNYEIINSSGEPIEVPSAWDKFLMFWDVYGGDYDSACMEIGGQTICEGENVSLTLELLDYSNAAKANEYNEYIRSNAILSELDSDNQIIGVVCEHENAHLSLVGIDIMNKELWLVLTIFVILAPFLAYALDKKR